MSARTEQLERAPRAVPTDPRDVGGKAAGLLSLEALGAPVPPFRVIGADLFRAHMRCGDVPAALGETVLLLADSPPGAGVPSPELGEASARLRAAVESAPPDEALRDAVHAAVAELGDGPYAVRSSMAGEDSARHSFAGQLDSHLFVADADEAVEATRRCFGSAFADRALAYAARTGLAPAEVRMAVVIQTMVDADTSGVAFTANPVSGSRDECLVSAAYGLGEGVVAGIAAVDEYVWTPDGGETAATIAAKDVQVVRSPAGSGTEEVAVPEHLRDARVLGAEQVAEVAREARRIAAAAGRPMDVEWCYAGGRLWVLQARPITSLGADSDEPVRTFDNSNIQENYSGVTTPLTFSFTARAYTTVFTALLRELGIGRRSLGEFEPSARTLLAFVDGRIYYNLESWAHMFGHLPGGDRRTEEVTKVMWHTRWERERAATPPLGPRVRHRVEAARAGARLVRHFALMNRSVDSFLARFESIYRTVDRDAVREMSLSELYATIHRLYAELLDHWEVPNVNDLRVMMSCGRLRRLLERLYEPDEVDPRLADLLCGIEGIESAAPTRMLIEVANDARRDPAVAGAIRAGSPDEALARLRELAPDLSARLDRYVDLYGDRSIGELKLETIPMKDDRGFVVGVLRNYLDGHEIDPDALQRAERERYRAALAEVESRVPSWRRPLLRREVALARSAVKAREAMRLRRTRAFGLARDVYMAMGARLHEAGVLEDARDAVYLTVDELESFIDGRAVSLDLAAIVAARKVEYARHELEPVRDRFTAAGSPYLGARSATDAEPPVAPRADGDAATLRGLGCCAGVVEAPVRLMLDPREAMSVNGQVLCTVRTDPGWAPLFPTASGLVVERGSTLSHSAVVAREFGLPTVVGVPDVTRILRDGENVRVDGGAGVVTRLDRSPPPAA